MSVFNFSTQTLLSINCTKRSDVTNVNSLTILLFFLFILNTQTYIYTHTDTPTQLPLFVCLFANYYSSYQKNKIKNKKEDSYCLELI